MAERFGGPILKNKLFTFTSYEHWNDAQPLPFTLTVPTALERAGDFSQSSRNGVIRNIFDPMTSTGSSGTRTQFAGNKIDPEPLRPDSFEIVGGDTAAESTGQPGQLAGFQG